MFNQHVFAGDAKIGCAVLHIGGHVAGAYDNEADVGVVGGDDEFARVFGGFARHNACGGEQGQGFFKDATFG